MCGMKTYRHSGRVKLLARQKDSLLDGFIQVPSGCKLFNQTCLSTMIQHRLMQVSILQASEDHHGYPRAVMIGKEPKQ